MESQEKPMMLLLLVLFLSTTTVHGASLHRERRETSTVAQLGPNQQLKGIVEQTNGVPINTFYGVRFAEAPTGSRRFAKPVEAQGWTGARDALQPSPMCVQERGPVPSTEQSEDCLFLNVFSPNLNGSMPVMFWIHGGAFHTGSANGEKMSSLSSHGVVVVAANYRLGPFGFLSTGDDVMPGNFGMLDQVLALNWVQKNIRAFGGDPANVTIFGQSAGSASVSMHTISPLSAGLFHRAIMESGSSLCLWAVERKESKYPLRSFTQLLAERMNCAGNLNDSSEVMKCLQTADAQVIKEASLGLRQNLQTDVIETPRIETTFGFLPDYPWKLLQSGKFNKVDTLRGYNSGEWSFIIQDSDNNGLTISEYNAYLGSLSRTYGSTKTPETISLMKKEYDVTAVTDPFARRETLRTALVDTLFSLSAFYELDIIVNQTDPSTRHYTFEVDYRISDTLTPAWMGVLHSGERPLVFGSAKASATDIDVSNAVQTMWTNFAKHGNPTATSVTMGGKDVTWGQYGPINKPTLVIGSTASSLTSPRRDKIQMMVDMLELLRGD